MQLGFLGNNAIPAQLPSSPRPNRGLHTVQQTTAPALDSAWLTAYLFCNS